MVILPSPRRVHAWAVPVVAALALVVQSLALHVAPAGAMSNPTLTINASSSTSVGLQIFANSNLMGASNPTGTITFKLFAPGDTSCASPIFNSTVAVTSSSVNSARYTTAAAGTYRWVSTYSGDANNAAVGPTSCTDPAAAVIVDKASTALSVAAPAPAGGTIHASATLSGGFGPTGSITFLLAPPGDTFCSAPPVFTSTVAVSGARTYDSANFTPTQAGTYKWRATYTGDANSLGAGPTPCLDSNAAVTVGAPPPPPTPPPHWGHYQWGSESSATRAFWLLDRTGDSAMHTAIANWAAWWNDGRSKTDLALPYVAVYVDDANVGQCYHTGNPDYSLAMACAGGAGSPNGGTADLTFAPSSHPHMVSPFITLHPGLDANSLATSVCHRMGSVMGLADNPAADSCMSPSPPRATFLWYNPTDGSGALSLYDSHAD